MAVLGTGILIEQLPYEPGPKQTLLSRGKRGCSVSGKILCKAAAQQNDPRHP